MTLVHPEVVDLPERLADAFMMISVLSELIAALAGIITTYQPHLRAL